jgi:hypothetical protein
MAKWCSSTILDAALSYISTNCDRMFLNTTQPANFAEANGALKLAQFNMAGGNYTGPSANGNSRYLQVNAMNGVNAAANGNANHVSLANSGGTNLHYVTTCAVQAIVIGNPIQINAWNIQFDQPT